MEGLNLCAPENDRGDDHPFIIVSLSSGGPRIITIP